MKHFSKCLALALTLALMLSACGTAPAAPSEVTSSGAAAPEVISSEAASSEAAAPEVTSSEAAPSEAAAPEVTSSEVAPSEAAGNARYTITDDAGEKVTPTENMTFLAPYHDAPESYPVNLVPNDFEVTVTAHVDGIELQYGPYMEDMEMFMLGNVYDNNKYGPVENHPMKAGESLSVKISNPKDEFAVEGPRTAPIYALNVLDVETDRYELFFFQVQQ